MVRDGNADRDVAANSAENEKIKKIIEYYDGRVSQYGTSGKSTLLDDNMRTLELETATSWIGKNDRVLDIFCGNGVSTIELAKHCASIVGVDLSKKMIDSARQLARGMSPAPANISFENGNILDLDKMFPAGSFDAVTSIRGLINIPTWELQQQAILNVHKILPKGGKFIFIEGSKDGLEKLNELRATYSMSPLGEPWYDRHFITSDLLRFMSKYFDVLDGKDMDIYFLVSRVLYPYAARPEEPRFDHVCNAVARLLVPYVQLNENATLLISKLFVKK